MPRARSRSFSASRTSSFSRGRSGRHSLTKANASQSELVTMPKTLRKSPQRISETHRPTVTYDTVEHSMSVNAHREGKKPFIIQCDFPEVLKTAAELRSVPLSPFKSPLQVTRDWASWPQGTSEEEFHFARAKQKDIIGLFIVLGACYLMFSHHHEHHTMEIPVINATESETSNPRAPLTVPEVSLASQALTLLCALVMTAVLRDRQPAPKKGSHQYWAVSIIGRAAFFTVQTLMLQTAYLWLAFFAAVYDSPALNAAVGRLAVWTNAQGFTLTVLYFAGYFGDKRIREVIEQYENEFGYSSWGAVQQLMHSPSAVVAVVDLFYLRDPAWLKIYTPTLTTIGIIAFLYISGYVMFLRYVSVKLRPGTLVYPFVAEFGTLKGKAAFTLTIWSVVMAVTSTMHVLSLS